MPEVHRIAAAAASNLLRNVAHGDRVILQTKTGDGRVTHIELDGVFHGQSAILVGGAPSLLQQDMRLLERRGVLSVAMNNAAMHFQPAAWVCSDNPACFDPRIPLDPRIMKFAPEGVMHEGVKTPNGAAPFWKMPNTYFYQSSDKTPIDAWLDYKPRVPWMHATLMHSIYILYSLGVRRIILAGSDFGAGPGGRLYAHDVEIGSLQQKWNKDLYDAQAEELRTLAPYFKRRGLELIDASVNSRIDSTYRKITLEEAVSICLKNFPNSPAKPEDLPHCSQFAPEDLKRMVAGIRPESKTAQASHAAAVVRKARLGGGTTLV